MAISTYGVELKWGETVEAAAKVVDIKDFPDLIGEANTIETTTLSDAQQTFIPGIAQSSLMTFTCNYTSADYAKVNADTDKKLHYVLQFSDGSSFGWEGEHTCGVPGKGVDEVIEFTINITASTAVSFTAAAE